MEGTRGLDKRLGVVVSSSFLFIAARMSMMTFLAIFLVRERGLDEALVGLGFLVENLTRGLVAPPLGALSDRIGRRPVMMGTVALSALLLPLFVLIETPLHLFAWSLALGVAQGGWFPCLLALLLDLSPPERRQNVLALNYTALSLGYTLGVAPAGYLATAGYHWLALGSAAGAASVGVLLALGLRGPLPREASARGSLVERMRRAGSDGEFVRFMSLALVFPLGLGLITTALPLWASEGGLENGPLGVALSLNGVLLALLSLPVTVWLAARGPFRLVALAAPMVGASFLVLLWPPSFGVVLAATVVFTAGELVFSSALPTAVASLAKPGLRGAYQGAWSFVFSTTIGVSLFVSGLAKDVVGWSATWMGVTAVFLLAGAGLWLGRARFRRVATEREAAASGQRSSGADGSSA